MRHNLHLLILSISIVVISAMANAQEALPCANDAHDIESELRELGIGTDSTAFGALKNAVTDALLKIKPRYMQLYPGRAFEYALTIDKSEEGIELDTSIGKPAIICNEIVETDGLFSSYIVISFEVAQVEETP